MNKFAKTVVYMALVSCVSVLCVVSPAAGISTISVGESGGAWATAPYINTFDPTGAAQGGNSVCCSGRVIGQSFQVSETVSASSAYFELEQWAAGTFALSLYEVDDVANYQIRLPETPNPPVFGTLLAQGTGLSVPDTGETVVRFDFAPVFLNPTVSNEGYAFAFSQEGTSGHTMTVDANDALGASGGNFTFLVGADGSQAAFALDAVPGVIPEPASLALLGLGGLMMLRRRQR